MRRLVCLWGGTFLFFLLFLLAVSSLAWGSGHLQQPAGSCTQCHAEHNSPGGHNEWDTPHQYFGHVTYTVPDGSYSFDSDKCRLCHDVHEAPSNFHLLPASTISGVCMTCHDQTGAVGEYGMIEHFGGTVEGEHRVDVTSTVPGGPALGDVLKCNSCHTVHGNTDVADFISEDQARHMYPTVAYHNKLLRDNVGGSPKGTYKFYGSAWCAGCHDWRLPDSSHFNHPVDTSTSYQLFGTTSTYPSQYTLGGTSYECALCHANWLQPEILPPEGTNKNFTFYPVSAPPDGRVEPRPAAPLCQQCHEDSRDVELPWNGNPWLRPTSPSAPSEVYPTSQLPSSGLPPNPAFFTFPHQTTNPNLLVETGDDLCLNCHPASQLP